ncbi:MAG: phosphoadenosine phosphosulfate reductase family protein [Pseudomonadales bacterium]|jgi:phosphoadenosine phosphosulfate reductase
MTDIDFTPGSDLTAINAELAGKKPEEIISWAASLDKRTIMTTTFGDHSAVILHMVTSIMPHINIIWVDTGYNSSATYRFADKLMNWLDLKVQIFSPLMTSARRNVLMKGIPEVGEPLHDEFTRQVKLEPFERAFREIKPEVWITGVRSEQTEHRKNLDIVSWTKEGYLKVAPILDWTEKDLDDYLDEHKLPNEPDYFDPTKGQETRECGLHTKF